MADIFLSYSREDRAALEPLVDALKAAGYSVWWDRQLSGGTHFLKETEAELKAARAVLVVWTKTSIESHWVADEAGAGRDTGRLLPIALDGSTPPLGFRQFQVIDFSKWKNGDEAAFQDLLAALKRIAPPSGEASARPIAKKAGGGAMLRKPAVLGAMALAAVALIAVIAIQMLGSKPPPVETQRAAFFGFAATDADPLSLQVAGVATDETYSTLAAIGIEMAARGDTQGVELKEQMDTAAKLGARYGLAGSVRTAGNEVTVTIRLDDVQTRTTFWEKKLTGDRAQSESLPVQAAAKATNVLQCLVAIHPGMVREDAGALGIVTRACEADNADALARWQEAVGVAPKSAIAEFSTGLTWIIQSAPVSPDDRKMMLQQARQAFARAQALEPDRADVRSGMDLADIASDRPLAEIIGDLNTVLGLGVDRSRRRSISGAAMARLALLMTVGRHLEAASLARTDVAADPLNSNLQTGYALALSGSRKTGEARRIFEEANRRFADPTAWPLLAFLVISERDDLSPVVKAAPPGVNRELSACLQDVAKAARVVSTRKDGARRMSECIGLGAQPDAAAAIIADLGDVPTAYQILTPLLDRSNPIAFALGGGSLFGPPARALRADPRFLPLMKKRNVGIYQYWIDTKTQPDLCGTPEERDIPVCEALRKDQGK